MSSTLTREEALTRRVTRGAKRFGYLVAAVLNGVMLWLAHQLLDWEWPRFLTLEFNDLLPLLTFSFVVSIVANVLYAWSDTWPIKPIGEMTTAAISFVVALRTLRVFPFDFSGYEADWSWLARTIIVVAVVGSTIGFLVHLAKLVAGPPTSGEVA